MLPLCPTTFEVRRGPAFASFTPVESQTDDLEEAIREAQAKATPMRPVHVVNLETGKVEWPDLSEEEADMVVKARLGVEWDAVREWRDFVVVQVPLCKPLAGLEARSRESFNDAIARASTRCGFAQQS